MNLSTNLSLDLTQTLYLYEVWDDGRTEYTPDFDPMWTRTFEDGPTVSTIIDDLTGQVHGAPRWAFLYNTYEDLLKAVVERFPSDKTTLAVSREVSNLIHDAIGHVDYTNRQVHVLGASDFPSVIETDVILDRLGPDADDLDAHAMCIWLNQMTDGFGILPEDFTPDLYGPEVKAIREELEGA